MFSLSNIWWYLSNTLNVSCFICDCVKTSSKYVMTTSLRMRGQKILIISAENAAGPVEIPQKSLLNSFC